jgi:hypothetical protein
VTSHHFRVIVLLISFASAAPAHCEWSGTWSYDPISDLSQSSFPPADSKSYPYTDSLSVPLKNFGGELPYAQGGKVNLAGDVELKAADRSFSIYTDALVVNSTPGLGGFNSIDIQAHVYMSDVWRCITDVGHHAIKMTAFWYLHGSLNTSDVEGHYSTATPPVSPDYVNASARSELQISGTGVPDGPDPAHPALWGDSAHTVDSFLTVPDNYQKDPPLVVPITLLFQNSEYAPVLFQVYARTYASVGNDDLVNHRGGSATAILDMGHTFTWGGITSVTDADTGEPITDWTLTSASGADWAHAAVPEPGTAALAVVAFGMMLSWRFRFNPTPSRR